MNNYQDNFNDLYNIFAGENTNVLDVATNFSDTEISNTLRNSQSENDYE